MKERTEPAPGAGDLDAIIADVLSNRSRVSPVREAGVARGSRTGTAVDGNPEDAGGGAASVSIGLGGKVKEMQAHINATMARILIPAVQNSTSPKTRVPRKLTVRTATNKGAIKAAVLMPLAPFQYSTTRAQATSSVGMVMPSARGRA